MQAGVSVFANAGQLEGAACKVNCCEIMHMTADPVHGVLEMKKFSCKALPGDSRDPKHLAGVHARSVFEDIHVRTLYAKHGACGLCWRAGASMSVLCVWV
jgi:hypothetical protein